MTDVRVRPERPDDVAAVDAMVAAAFGDEGVDAVLRDLRVDHSWRDLSLLAERAGELVGHVSLVGAWLDAPDRLVDVLVLSPLSVRPDAQRGGVGSGLVRAALAAAGRRPEPVVFLEGDPAYYGPLGFRPGAERGFEAPSRRIPDAAFQHVLLPSYTSGLTGRLVYPDVFWRHDAVGLRG